MTFNRKNQLSILEKLYNSTENNAVVFYSANDSDLDEIIKEFLIDKDFFYYNSVQVSKDEQLRLFVNSINSQLSKLSISEYSYADALKVMQEVKCEKRVVVINEFQHIIRFSTDLIDEILKCINNKWGNQPVLFILTSTNQYFIENQIVEKLGSYAYELSGLIKLSELTFKDIVSYFGNYSTEDRILAYGITAGKSERIKAFNPDISLKDNIIQNILDKNSYLYQRGTSILPPELREHSVYNTILLSLANGYTKLNDIHKRTGYSRAKISVYLNNLIEHNLIEKIDSFDSLGKDNAVKGVYAIKDGFLSFFYRFVFPNMSMLDVLSPDKFYKNYIAENLADYGCYYFRKVCYEYLMILDKLEKLPIKIKESGIWLGKIGNIDIVCTDTNENTLIGYCEFTKDKMTFEDFEWLQFCVSKAKLSDDVYYLFSKNGFDERIHEYAGQKNNVVLIDAAML